MPEAPTGLVTGANSGIGKEITRLRAQGYPVPDEDVARLSPLGYAHINVLGRYTFPPPSGDQALRPLRDPDAAE